MTQIVISRFVSASRPFWQCWNVLLVRRPAVKLTCLPHFQSGPRMTRDPTPSIVKREGRAAAATFVGPAGPTSSMLAVDEVLAQAIVSRVHWNLVSSGRNNNLRDGFCHHYYRALSLSLSLSLFLSDSLNDEMSSSSSSFDVNAGEKKKATQPRSSSRFLLLVVFLLLPLHYGKLFTHTHIHTQAHFTTPSRFAPRLWGGQNMLEMLENFCTFYTTLPSIPTH